MQIEFEGKVHTLDLDAISVSEARYIKHKTGYRPGELYDGIAAVDPDCMAALFWLMKKQSGGKVMDIDRLDFPLVEFGHVLVTGLLRESDEEAEAEAAPKDE